MDWCWSRNSNTLATWCEELTHWKRPWCWEGLGAGGEGDDRGWDGWMASPTQWAWVWVNSGSLWGTGRAGVLWFMESQRVGDWVGDWATELNWTDSPWSCSRKWQVTPNILAWKILWTEEPGGLQSIESQRVGHDCVTNTFTFHFCFTAFHLCGNSILQSQRAWALSLTTGLLVRI